MKINELMIGDWVQVPSELNRYKRIRSTFDMDSAVLYEPIPLTTEILEKNGFESCKEGYDIGIPLLYWDKYCTAVCGWTHCSNIIEVFDCRYVHQLQHALRLCGIIKEIEL